jgi:hypothetical protein
MSQLSKDRRMVVNWHGSDPVTMEPVGHPRTPRRSVGLDATSVSMRGFRGLRQPFMRISHPDEA